MQTFLPFPSFAASAAALDDRRLGKQRVETLQILRALHVEEYGWARHPAVLMWRGCTRALVAYGFAMVDEWRRRGYADMTRPLIAEFARPRAALGEAQLPADELPPWLGWQALHRSHRAALVRKDPLAYGAVFAEVSADQPYVWPQPPAGPEPQPPCSAWVVRAASAAVLDAFRRSACVGLPAAFGRSDATRKQRRQFDSFLSTVDAGDRVVAFTADQLYCGVVAGDPQRQAVVGVDHVARPVVWGVAVARTTLVRPYQLQDPRSLFALRGEPVVEQAADQVARQAGSGAWPGVPR